MFVPKYRIRKIAPTQRIVFKYAIDCSSHTCRGTVTCASTYWGARYALWKHKRAHEKYGDHKDVVVWEE